jgi:ATP-dependent Clp protease adapter protein ClpS
LLLLSINVITLNIYGSELDSFTSMSLHCNLLPDCFMFDDDNSFRLMLWSRLRSSTIPNN